LDVKVPELFENLMSNWAAPDTRDEIVAGMGRIDEAAKKAKGKPFAALDPAARLEVLKGHEPAALKPNLEKASKGGGIAMMMGPPATDEGYARMRSLIIKLFYLTEPALTQELSYEHDPGGYEPSVPITPESRPEGGLSPI
ncbi:MAG: gluconate 2-dehydrogenase subunit 3 family protein, partial [Novosphingobium sp.]|nr:gluconate 2-dehydrogenase subunit 3 family protein [Novosphingobium sp.]